MEYGALKPAERRQPAFGQFQLQVLKIVFAERKVSEEIVATTLPVWTRQMILVLALCCLPLNSLEQAAQSLIEGIRFALVSRCGYWCYVVHRIH